MEYMCVGGQVGTGARAEAGAGVRWGCQVKVRYLFSCGRVRVVNRQSSVGRVILGCFTFYHLETDSEKRGVCMVLLRHFGVG